MHCGYKDLKDTAMSQRGSQSNKGTEEQTIAKARDGAVMEMGESA